MNALGPLCDSLGRLLWAVSWQAALLVALVWVAALACRRTTAAFRYRLWCIVLLRLCLPLALTFPQTPRSALRTPHLLVLCWLAVVLGLSLLVLIHTWRLARRRRTLTEIRRTDLKTLFVNLRARMGIRRPVALLYADPALAEAGPLTLGLFRPAVILPPRVADGWALEDLAPVLLHELAHVRRRDLPVNFIQMIVQLVYFFHPLVWLANWRIRQEREWACDDLAVQKIGGRPDLYSRAFLRIIEECRGKDSPAPAGPK